jgi:crossover junction endodeoxyribonuclease RusA
MITITLPWPDKRLNPNNPSWKSKIRPTKEAREYARYMTLSHILNCEYRPPERVSIKYTFYPPDKRRRDITNFVGSMKASQDGVADALGIDDSKFELEKPVWGDVIRGGRVTLRLEELE